MKNLQIEHYDALLFDLDGTLADTMPLHNQAWISALKDLGYPMTPEILFEYAGVSTFKTAEIFNERFGWELNPQSFASEKDNRFLQNIHLVRPIEGVLKIAKQNFQRKPMAIVSGGSRLMIESILNTLQIGDLFPIRICAEDTLHGKPHPEPFLSAARLLKVKPEKCLVFEDGEPGIQGAKLSAMGVVKVGLNHELLFLG